MEVEAKAEPLEEVLGDFAAAAPSSPVPEDPPAEVAVPVRNKLSPSKLNLFRL